MSYPYENAVHRIIAALHDAERDLVGSVVVLFGGEAGEVRDVKLDEAHGLCLTLDEEHWLYRRRWYPVSTIKDRSRVGFQ